MSVATSTRLVSPGSFEDGRARMDQCFANFACPLQQVEPQSSGCPQGVDWQDAEDQQSNGSHVSSSASCVANEPFEEYQKPSAGYRGSITSAVANATHQLGSLRLSMTDAARRASDLVADQMGQTLLDSMEPAGLPSVPTALPFCYGTA